MLITWPGLCVHHAKFEAVAKGAAGGDGDRVLPS